MRSIGEVVWGILIAWVRYPFDYLSLFNGQIAWFKAVFLHDDACVYFWHLHFVYVLILETLHEGALENGWNLLLVIYDSIFFTEITFFTLVVKLGVVWFLNRGGTLLTDNCTFSEKVCWFPILKLCFTRIFLELVHEYRFYGRVGPNLLGLFRKFNRVFLRLFRILVFTRVKPKEIWKLLTVIFWFLFDFFFYLGGSMLLKLIDRLKKSPRWGLFLVLILLLCILRIEPKTIIHIFVNLRKFKYIYILFWSLILFLI